MVISDTPAAKDDGTAAFDPYDAQVLASIRAPQDIDAFLGHTMQIALFPDIDLKRILTAVAQQFSSDRR